MAKIRASTNGHPSYVETSRNPGQTSNSAPTVLNYSSISSHLILSKARGEPSVPVVFVPSNAGEKPLARHVLPASGIVTNNRQTSTTGQSAVYILPLIQIW